MNVSHCVFLLGAGVSLPAGSPKTNDLTNAILTGSCVVRRLDGTYYLLDEHDNPGADDFPLEVVPSIVRLLKARIDEYYASVPAHITNYEEIYYIARQLCDDALGEYENPIVKPFSRLISGDIERLLRDMSPHGVQTPQDLYRETVNYIHDVVWHSLDVQAKRLDHLPVLVDAASQVTRTTVFTLNHDLLIEQSMGSAGIPIEDGFSQAVKGVRYRYWAPARFEVSDAKVHLYKLHGSINWFQLPEQHQGRIVPRLGIPCDGNHWSSLDPIDRRPLFLVGTFNKILQYSSGVFAYIHNAFRVTLDKADVLVVSGYSFGDKGVNATIVDWLLASHKPRLVVLHEKPSELIAGARGAIANNWSYWHGDGLVRTVNKWFGDTSWAEVLQTAS